MLGGLSSAPLIAVSVLADAGRTKQCSFDSGISSGRVRRKEPDNEAWSQTHALSFCRYGCVCVSLCRSSERVLLKKRFCGGGCSSMC